MNKPVLYLQGMHGLGDNLHQRAILRLLMPDHDVTLESSWFSIYHDLIAQGLKVVHRPIALRTQLKNAQRESRLFHPPQPTLQAASHARRVRIMYTRNNIMATKSQTVLEAMMASVNLAHRYSEADYRLPLLPTWRESANVLIETWKPNKPLLIYRPLTMRPEWAGSGVRSANPKHYAEIVSFFRDQFFVVSVADLENNKEWIIGPTLKADVTLHRGELNVETLCAVVARATALYTAGGFGVVMGPAVGTGVISVGGGYENPSWVDSGKKFAPFLSIPTINPCVCSSSGCRQPCQKEIDIPRAETMVRSFLTTKFGIEPQRDRPISEMFDGDINAKPVLPTTSYYPRYTMPSHLGRVGGVKA